VQLYDQVYIYINGKLLAENTSVSTSLESDQQEVKTLVRGFAGISPGPVHRVIDLENVVPVKGMEFAIEKAFLESAELDVRLQLGGSGAKYEGKGFVRSGIKVSGGVGKTTDLAYSLICDPGEFK
jgi:hypothetical protein